ncbi:hypothetical protein ACP70R_003742 [Stipagrostis hirtigluma subsp. patula]
MQATAAEFAWWLGLLLGAAPLLALALWHCNDACHRAAFALRRRGHGRLPPGHMGLPFVGESLALAWYFKRARRPDGFVHAKQRRYGAAAAAAGVYRTHLFGKPAVVACSPAAIRFVFNSPDSFGAHWPAPEIVGVSSVVNVEGARHARLRGFVLAAVTRPAALRAIARVVQPRVAAALRLWADKGTVAAAAEFRKLTFENILKMFVSMEPSPLTDAIGECFAGVVAGFKAFPLDLPGTAFRHALRCRRKLNAVFREELEKRKKASRDHGEEDPMSGLMRMEDETGKKLSDEEVVDNIVSLVLAGYESTSNVLMWAAYHLAKSPEFLRKLREENVAVSRDKNGGFITPDDIPNMKYTAKVVEESLRVANVTPMVHRVARRDVEYKGYTIPQGWSVVVWLRSLQTDPSYYDDPLRFNPDRWDVFGGGWELLNPDAEVVCYPLAKPVDGAAMSFSKL